jgi:molecular chaperone DnaJ
VADYYALLGIARDCSEEDLKKAYRKLAMQYHPDRNDGSKDSEEKFKEITEAYDTLRDPQKRALYDRYGEAGLRRAGAGAAHHVDLSEALGIFMRDFGFGGIEDLFGGGAGRQRGGPVTGADLRVNVTLSFAEAATGVERVLHVKMLDACEKCAGTGAEPGTKPKRCATCAGQGEVQRAQRSFFGQFVSVAPCPTCHGTGQVIETPCKKCKGEGRQRVDKAITVQIPAGVASGQYLVMRGSGNAGPMGGPRGDIAVMFDVQEDDRFERDGAELFTEVLVTYSQLVLGADIQAPGVSGPLSLRLPGGTPSGQVFTLRGRGLPRVNASGNGDLHVRVQLWTPTQVSAEQKKALEHLKEVESVPPESRPKDLWGWLKEALGA